ncbi:MAG: acetamidase/formamidase family protein [Dongiaceae bacterium]
MPPVVTVAPGDAVAVELLNPGGGQLTSASTADQVAKLVSGRVNPVTGPIFIDGAEPGDAVKITIESLETCGWGWSALIPGFGLLADDFPDPYVVPWRHDRTGREPALFGPPRIPLKPLIGSIGLALARPGAHDVLPPRRVGDIDAVRAMIDLPQRHPGLPAQDAYVLCGVCADLRISQIVDRPNWLASLYFPRKVFG